MEVMEDGNLMDKVNILIQRDMEFYRAKQTVLQETLCPGIIGGRLDFPRSASFAAVKLVVWWEEEYVAAYRKPSGFFQKNTEGNRDSLETSGGCGGIVRSSDPSKFVSALGKSADQLLEHLHILTQEALDHADLTVLTGTIGAAAILKNCLWFYIQALNDNKTPSIDPLYNAYKKYHEMCEALAERLLDLHSRLLSLYILQDADCLDWENNKLFFESERGSYIIQMWWLYMQGTREDLWNTVPPKMAQRVFSGMLNESLTILNVRYTQSVPSEARSHLLLVDLSNLLLCVAQLLPSICDRADDFVHHLSGNSNGKTLKDIHVKCQELYCCFLLRGSPLDCLNKVLEKPVEEINLLKSKTPGPVPWAIFSLSDIFKTDGSTHKTPVVDENSYLALELKVLLAQPQPNWALLLKVLCSRNFKVLQLLLEEFMRECHVEMKRVGEKPVDCGNLLCAADGSCREVEARSTTLNLDHYYDLIVAVSHVLFSVGSDDELKEYFVDVVVRYPNWVQCFEKLSVWNQIRFPWYEAIANLVSPILPLVVEVVIKALSTGATMYQAMSVIIACFSQYWDLIDASLPRVARIFEEALPSYVTPVGKSVLIQILVSALYTNLIAISEDDLMKKEVTFQDSSRNDEAANPYETPSTNHKQKSAISIGNAALAAAEALCSIDEDYKHTDQIEEFLKQTREARDDLSFFTSPGSKRVDHNQQMCEMLASEMLTTAQGKRSLKVPVSNLNRLSRKCNRGQYFQTIFHFIKNNSDWLNWKLGVVGGTKRGNAPNKVFCPPDPLLHKMFHIDHRPFDQFLTKDLKPKWQTLLQIPMGLTLEKVWLQVSRRWEFRDPSRSPTLSATEADIVNKLCLKLKQ